MVFCMTAEACTQGITVPLHELSVTHRRGQLPLSKQQWCAKVYTDTEDCALLWGNLFTQKRSMAQPTIGTHHLSISRLDL